MDTNRWLVKSGGVVLGPFSTDEVSRKLRGREFAVIDEISLPRARWHMIRDVPAFAALVEEIRQGLSHSREDTEIQGYTKTFTDSQTLTGEMSTESEDAIAASMAKEANPALVAPADPPLEIMPRSSRPDLVQPMRKYGLDRQRTELSERRPKMRFGSGFWIGTGMIAIAIVFLVIASSKNGLNRIGGDAGKLSTLASSAWKKGDFETALSLYQRLEQEAPGRPEIAVRLAPLMMKLQGSTVEAKRMLEIAMKNSPSEEEKIEIELGLGLASLESDDYRQAREHFARAVPNWMAYFNTGVTAVKDKSFDEALNSFRWAGDRAPALVLLAKAVAMQEEGFTPTARKEAERAVQRVVERSKDFLQEAFVVSAYLKLLSGDKKSAINNVAQAISVDPEMTDEHFHNPLIELDLLSWSALLPLCRQLNEDLNVSASMSLMALCLAKSNLLPEGLKTVEQGFTKYPNDPNLQAMNGYLLTMAGQDDAAQASLKLAMRKEAPNLALLTWARLCQKQGDVECEEETWEKLAARKHPPLSALTGLARLRHDRGDRETAGALLVKAETLSPTYIPLLQLREKTASR